MEAFYYKEMAALQDTHWWYEGRRRILRTMIAQLALHERAHILEAGCGPGANLKMLDEFGHVSAFEPDEFAAGYAKDLSGLPVAQGGLPEPFPFPGSAFDLVCAFDVIEHIEDDAAAVQTLYDHTKPGGCAVFTVPAHQWMWSQHDEVNAHKRRYSRAGLRKVLEQAGYQIDIISYYNMWLFPPAALVRLIKKWTGLGDGKSDVSMPPKVLNNILCGLFASERFLLPLLPLPFGLSIIAVCRK